MLNWLCNLLRVSVDLDDLAGKIFKKASFEKGIFGNAYGLLGQICLFLNMYYLLPDRNSSDTEKTFGQKTSLIHCHFGKLFEDEPFSLELACDALQKNQSEWHPLTVFPSFDKDILLYLCFMGGKNEMVALKDKAGNRLSFTASVDYALEDVEVSIRFENNVQVSNDGMRAEAIFSGSLCLASHEEGFQGIYLKEFLERLISELSPKLSYTVYQFPDDDSFMKVASKIDGLMNMKVPFLAPPNLRWPDFIVSLNDVESNFKFGHFDRTRNRDGIDIRLHCGITGQSKDHLDLKLDTMKSILKKVPMESKLHLVYVKRLNSSYFQRKGNSYESFLQANPSCRTLLIFKLVLSARSTISLEPVKGIPNSNATSDTRCLVIFIEKEQKEWSHSQ